MLDDDFPARHAELARGYGGRADPDDPALVQAMQVILHLPKQQPPPRSRVLAAAATACVALCMDERVGSAGEWHERYLGWKRSRMRKVSRRARGAQWLAAGEIDGVAVDLDGAQVRALVPGPVGELDPRITRLQVSGTDLEPDEPGDPDPDLPVLWVNPQLRMTVGKAAAQVGHASMLLAGAMTTDDVYAWSRRDYRCAVREADPSVWRRLTELVRNGAAIAVRDAGFTEVAPGSVTVIAPVRPRSSVA